MVKDRIFTLQQIIESENNFIRKYSQKKILSIAGEKIANYLYEYFSSKKILFICGKGNNGMDGINAFGYLKSRKVKVEKFVINNSNKNNICFEELNKKVSKNNLIIDCIFGTGLNRKIKGDFEKIIKLINISKKKIISVDVPSGVNGNNGQISSCVVNASKTIVMGLNKPAYFLLPSKSFCGDLIFLDLGLKPPKDCSPKVSLIRKNLFVKKVPKFGINTNKYKKGHVLVIGGEMSGASRIAAISARKVGAGLSTIAVIKRYLKFYNSIDPGTILKEFNFNLLENKDVLIIGPGLGRSVRKSEIIKIIQTFTRPIVIDADAISIFKNHKVEFYNLLTKKKDIVVTPHEGEFKRVFNFPDKDKIKSSLKASENINNTVLFKGNDTVVAFPDKEVFIDNNATQTLASAGTGDMLCGLIAGFLAQKMDFKSAIQTSLWINGKLSKIKKNVIIEDFLSSIPTVLSLIKNNN